MCVCMCNSGTQDSSISHSAMSASAATAAQNAQAVGRSLLRSVTAAANRAAGVVGDTLTPPVIQQLNLAFPIQVCLCHSLSTHAHSCIHTHKHTHSRIDTVLSAMALARVLHRQTSLCSEECRGQPPSPHTYIHRRIQTVFPSVQRMACL